MHTHTHANEIQRERERERERGEGSVEPPHAFQECRESVIELQCNSKFIYFKKNIEVLEVAQNGFFGMLDGARMALLHTDTDTDTDMRITGVVAV
jgi:hypothetical protein